MKTEYKMLLQNLLEPLIDPNDNYKSIKDSTDRLYEFFEAISGVNNFEEVYIKDMETDHGRAIGTYWAGKCIHEFMRTKKFIHGVYLGILEAKQKFPDTRIHILYAGTGPFGSLLLPLTALFEPREISITGIEINSESANVLQQVINKLDIRAYINEIQICDATTINIQHLAPVHMMISETMLNALRREPQVSIMRNLVPQMVEGGIWIPENIHVELHGVDPRRDHHQMLGTLPHGESASIFIGEVICLNKISCLKAESFNSIHIIDKEQYDRSYRNLVLKTSIDVLGDIHIDNNECSLTLPQRILSLKPEDKLPKQFQFNYNISQNPGFEYSIVFYNDENQCDKS
ncbi:hypothetical protein [Bacteroides sp.]|uniref:hypothetical protein n=1 Tax=Bacteroides sp. TaxID=29523 RepID=UPI0026198021|nr:hypothetical protein [Bacteroides sp.]MDD3040983.1 hypothetical protein [Bacteroides sp.]